MRIDTVSYFSVSLPGIREQQTAIARLNQQIASGMALLAPRDDPLATEKVLELSNRVATRSQHAANQDRAELALKYEQTVIQEMQQTLTSARSLLSISPFNNMELRNIHAEQLKGSFNHLLGLLNARDPSGDFIFGGHVTDSAPFANTSLDTDPVVPVDTAYGGTPDPGGLRRLAIEEGRAVQVNDNLAGVFLFTDSGFIDPANGAGPDQDQHDLLENLAYAIAELPGASITVDEINRLATLIDKTLERLALVEHRVAGAMGEVLDARGTTQALLLQEKNALGEIQQVDQAAAIIELQTRQTTLEAANRAYARTSGLSLFNFLG